MGEAERARDQVAALGRNYGRQLIEMTLSASAATMSKEQAIAFLEGVSEHLRDIAVRIENSGVGGELAALWFEAAHQEVHQRLDEL
jgi:hypothetical protein